MSEAIDLDVLWKKRGGAVKALRQLTAYAHWCIGRRSTATPGGRQVALLPAEEIVQEALLKAFTDEPSPTDGEAFFKLVRRKLDNALRTLEKSPKPIPTIPIVAGLATVGTVSHNTIADEQSPNPADGILASEEEARSQKLIEETRRRLKSPDCLEARLLTLLVDQVGDKARMCIMLNVDSAKFDRLKHSLKIIATAAKADLEKIAKR